VVSDASIYRGIGRKLSWYQAYQSPKTSSFIRHFRRLNGLTSDHLSFNSLTPNHHSSQGGESRHPTKERPTRKRQTDRGLRPLYLRYSPSHREHRLRGEQLQLTCSNPKRSNQIQHLYREHWPGRYQMSGRTPHHSSRGAWYFLINRSIYRMTEASRIKQAVAFEHRDEDA
jgi:hypothetical protein